MNPSPLTIQSNNSYSEFLLDSRTSPDGQIQLELLLPDISCAACCLKIENRLLALPGIERANVSLVEKRLSLVGDASSDLPAVIDRLKSLGYPPRTATPVDGFVADRRRLLGRLGVAGIGMMQVMMFSLAGYVAGDGGIEPAYEALMRWASLAIAIPVTFYGAMPFHKAALRHLANRSLGMDLPVSIAILSAFSLSTINTLAGNGEVYFDSACMFTFFLLTGRFLELSARHAYQLDQSLAEHLLPRFAVLVDGSQVLLSALVLGDCVVVNPGETISADGVIVDGVSSADESAFTGEVSPRRKIVGDKVLAGTANIDGRIVVRIDAPYDKWTISGLSRMHRSAVSFRPRFANLADRIASRFIGVILLLAFGTAVYWYVMGSSEWFVIALSVLVVSCPCALSLATPIAYSVASGAIRKLGVLVGNGVFLEKLNRTTAVVFDKTGTLTEGRLDLTRVQLVEPSLGVKAAINLAASLEMGSHHPIARTFIDKADESYTVCEPQSVPGCGVAGSIAGDFYQLGRPEWLGDDDSDQALPAGSSFRAPDTVSNWVGLTKNHKLVCWFALQDLPRADAKSVCDRLKHTGKRTVIFSGDQSKTGTTLAHSLASDQVQMGMSPQDKLDGLRALQAQGEVVLMVGDGINDTGALAAADLSIAVNPVDVIVSSAADATLVGSHLSSVPQLIEYSSRVAAVIRQNLTWAFVYNMAVIPAAMSGFIVPWIAALGMSLSSLLVILNACRLARVQ